MIFSVSSFSQSPFEIEANIGGGSLHGALSASTPNSFPNMSFGLRRNINPSLAISGNYTHLTFEGREGREGGDFQISVRELSALLEWYPLKRVKLEGINLGKKAHYVRAFQPYLNGGLTLASTHIDKYNTLMSCDDDFCTILTGFPAIQIGSGFRLFFNEYLAMNMNVAWRYTNVDQIDNIISGKDDWYVNAQVGVVWAIRKCNSVD